MAFLDNSGDIIIDAVLTDHGRYRLAKGDGSFAIEYFALGDDEIDYALYDADAPTDQGNLEIMQTPILEAFTNNASSLKSKLITINQNNLLYLPVLRANNLLNSAENTDLGMYVVACTETTEVNASGSQPNLNGVTVGMGSEIRIDQGVDNDAQSPSYLLPQILVETQYSVQIDNRLGMIVSKNGTNGTIVTNQASYIDDDQIASYIYTLNTDDAFVSENTEVGQTNEVIAGPRGTILTFAIQASIELNTSSYLFSQMGSTAYIAGIGDVQYIDSTVRIEGMTTGASVDLPMRFVRSVS